MRFMVFCRMQMFIWNNIFFSLGFDVREHYKDFGGDYAAYIAPVCNLYFSLGVKWSKSVKDSENFNVLFGSFFIGQ